MRTTVEGLATSSALFPPLHSAAAVGELLEAIRVTQFSDVATATVTDASYIASVSANIGSASLAGLFVVRNGRRWLREPHTQRAARRRSNELEDLAYDAYRAFDFGDRRTVDRFLRILFPRLQKYCEERISALREALFEELNKGWNQPFDEPPVWLDPRSENPAGWLARRIFCASTDILEERNHRDEFTRRLAVLHKRLRNDPEFPNVDKPVQEHLEGEWARLREANLLGDWPEDPADIVAHRYNWVDQLLRHIEDSGREVSSARARVLIQARLEEWSMDDTLEELGGEHAWRAFKTTWKLEYERVFAQS